MTPAQIDLVKQSWAEVAPDIDGVASLFYGKLFILNPELKALFKGDMTEQGRKLMAILNTAINSLEKFETILPAVQDMGVRHINYGVKDEDYDTVGEALIWTLSKGLGDSFTDEVKEAWLTTYTTIATIMKTAAAQAA